MVNPAIVATAYGGPEVLAVVDAPVADPGPGQVLVDIRAAAINPVDYKLYSGWRGQDPGQLPMSVGLEAAGIVRTVGGAVDGPSGPIHPGDEVILYPLPGASAAAVLAPADSVVAKPSTLSFEEASGLMLTGTTAVHALHVVGVAAGDTVVLHGAAGGVGLMAVQLAVADGIRVIATAGDTQHDLLCGLGAEPVVYGEGLLERIQALAPDGVDAAVDLVGTDEAADVSIALVADHDRITTIVSSSRAGRLGIKALGMGPGADPGTDLRAEARLELVRRAEAGTLHVLVAATFPLAEAEAAHRQLAGGHTHGKIVLIP